jgi:hypothetical protein
MVTTRLHIVKKKLQKDGYFAKPLSAVLLLVFALAMTVSFGIKES